MGGWGGSVLKLSGDSMLQRLQSVTCFIFVPVTSTLSWNSAQMILNIFVNLYQ